MNQGHKLKVLLIEDEEASAQLAFSFLNPKKCDIHRVKNGREAISKLMEQPYDLIVLDWEMPIKNGGDVLMISEFILEKSKEKGRIPLVLYTGIDASKIDMPNVSHFQLVDFWSKMDSLSRINKRADSLLDRLQRRMI